MIFASIEQENASACQAFDVLNRQPKWASVQERLGRANIRHCRLSHTLNTLQSRRREALRHFTFQAVTYLDLVVDSVTADAYCNVLPLMIREAYTFFTGWPAQVMEPVRQDAAGFERRIEFRYRRWVTRAYLRAQAAIATPELLDNDQPVAPHNSSGNNTRTPNPLLDNLFLERHTLRDATTPEGSSTQPASPATTEGRPPATPGPPPAPAASIRCEAKGPVLNVSLIIGWMEEEGFTNESLAETLNISPRAVSSIRNNGDYHGIDAITKLANKTGRDREDLYLPPEAST